MLIYTIKFAIISKKVCTLLNKLEDVKSINLRKCICFGILSLGILETIALFFDNVLV